MSEECELRLDLTAELPRRLTLRSNGDDLVAQVFLPTGEFSSRAVAFAIAPLEDALFAQGLDGPVLWLDGAAFDLTESEAQQVREMFPEIRV